jgi:hypothetical protein
VYESCVIAEGDYRIVPRNSTDRCIGGEGKNRRGSFMALADVGGSGQVWHLKQFEEDEHCIYQGEGQQKKIVWENFGYCSIKQYKEEGEQEEYENYRWVIEDRGMEEKGQQLYSIRNLCWGTRMNYEDGGDVYCPSDGKGLFPKDENYEQWVK